MTELTDRIRTLRDAIATRVAENKQIVDSIEGDGTDGSPLTLTAEHRDAFRKNLAEVREITADLNLLTETDEAKSFVERFNGRTTDPVALAAFAAAHEKGSGRSTLGEAFTASDEFKAMIDAGRLTMDRPFTVAGDLGSMWRGGRKDVYTTMPSGTPGQFGTVERDAIVERANRTARVRDLFPARPTSAGIIEYFRQTGFTNAASVVPERDGSSFAAKPQSALTFSGEQAPVRTIAHWEAAHRSALADEPQLQGIVENELLYGLRLHEDYQILRGTGTSEDILGILNTSGVQTYSQASVATDNKADALRRAMTKALLAYYEPTGVVVHDSDWESIELTKSAGDEKFYLFSATIQDGGAPRVWRVPVVPTPAIPQGTALVGSFGIGAQLYDREEGTIRVAEQHSDFFVRNAVVVLAEERLALAVKRPESFVKVTFSG